MYVPYIIFVSVVLVDLEILGSADVHGGEAAWEIRGNPP